MTHEQMQSDDASVSAYDAFFAVWTQVMPATSWRVVVVVRQQDGELIEDVDAGGRELRVHESGERRQGEVVPVLLPASSHPIPVRRRRQHQQAESPPLAVALDNLQVVEVFLQRSRQSEARAPAAHIVGTMLNENRVVSC